MPDAVAKIAVTFTLNGEPVMVRAWPMQRLLDVLREDLRMTGTKEGCGEGECGACSVFLDGVLVNACLVPVIQVAGSDLVTIEGVARDPRYEPLRAAFISCNGAQCGICTPGMMLASIDLLKNRPAPTETEMRDALAGNLCRGTGYVKIFDAIRAAAAAAAETGGTP